VTAPIVNTGSDTNPVIGIAAATTAAAGSLSAADKILINQLGTDSGWQALSYAANWSDFGAGFPAGSYKIDELGMVNLKGVFKKSIAIVAGETIATLPVGARPTTTHMFPFTYGSNVGELRVAPGGAITVQRGGAAVVADYNSFGGIRFDPAT
jgi:hypothetical protein